MAVVTVAPAGYTGQADYYCTGIHDEKIINAAFAFLSGAYGGGKAQLLEGTFNVLNFIDTTGGGAFASIALNYDNIVLEGNGVGTIIKYGIGGNALNTTIVWCPNNNAIVRNLKITSSSTVLAAVFVDNGGPTTHHATVDTVYVDGVSLIRNGIYGDGATTPIFKNNTVEHCVRTAIQVVLGAGNSFAKVINNTTISNTGSGILVGANYVLIDSNLVKDNSSKGINIASAGATSCIVRNNVCYNNSSDTGLANTNGQNFSDSGTDTQVSSNSWQSPVPGEPSNGTEHWTGRATPGAYDITRTAETFAAPYTWDLSGFASCPVGTKAVKLFVLIDTFTTNAVSSFMGAIWDYDYGAFSQYEAVVRGALIMLSYKPATAAAEYQIAVGEYEVKIGPSRKLKVGLGTTGGTQAIAASFKQAIL